MLTMKWRYTNILRFPYLYWAESLSYCCKNHCSAVYLEMSRVTLYLDVFRISISLPIKTYYYYMRCTYNQINYNLINNNNCCRYIHYEFHWRFEHIFWIFICTRNGQQSKVSIDTLCLIKKLKIIYKRGS